MTELRFLKLGYILSRDLQVFCGCIHAPQFKSLDTLQLSLLSYGFQGMATDGSSHTLEFSQAGWDDLVSQPLQFFGAEITTLRLDQRVPLRRRDRPLLHQLLISLGAVRVLEFNKTCLEGGFLSDLSVTGILPRLKVIRVAISRNCTMTLQLLAAVAKLRMEEGNPLATVEPLPAEDGLGRDFVRNERKVTRRRAYSISSKNDVHLSLECCRTAASLRVDRIYSSWTLTFPLHAVQLLPFSPIGIARIIGISALIEVVISPACIQTLRPRAQYRPELRRLSTLRLIDSLP